MAWLVVAMIWAMSNKQRGRHFIRKWRKHRGFSLRSLAGKLEKTPGVPLTSHANIGRIETYQQPYTQDILEAIAGVLNVTVVELLSVDPTKDGEVVDLVKLVKANDRDRAIKVLRALTGTDS